MWHDFIKDVKKAYENLPERSLSSGGYYRDRPLIIGDWEGARKEPEFTEDAVKFNGVGDDAHESMIIYRDYRKRIRDFALYSILYDRYLQKTNGDEKKAMDLLVKKYVRDEKGFYEKFNFPKDFPIYSNFCKTARKPYDLFVQIVLILAEVNFNKDGKIRFRYGSDGEEDDWDEAWRFVSENFPEHSGELMKILLMHKKNGESLDEGE